MKKFEHLGIAVSDINEGEKLYSRLLGIQPYKREVVEEQNVVTSFFRVGPNKIELVASTADDSVISKFLKKNGPGIHHLAIEVSDIRAEMARLREEGFHLLSDEPGRGADNKLVCFVHPKSTNGVLLELVQEIQK